MQNGGRQIEVSKEDTMQWLVEYSKDQKQFNIREYNGPKKGVYSNGYQVLMVCDTPEEAGETVKRFTKTKIENPKVFNFCVDEMADVEASIIADFMKYRLDNEKEGL